jgi:hypothetical protein
MIQKGIDVPFEYAQPAIIKAVSQTIAKRLSPAG